MKRFHFLFLVLLSALILLLCSCDNICKHESLSKRKIDATCTQSGEMIYSCNDCGYTYRESVIEPTGHVYTKVEVAPECTKDGYTKYTCECGFSYTSDNVSATGHDYVNTVTAATCKSEGYTTHKCKVCDYSYISNHINPLSHSYSKTVYEPTCNAPGYTVYSCNNCDNEYISDYTEPLEHSFVTVVNEPTCENSGSEAHSCAKCDYSYETQLDRLPHDLVALVTPPTCDLEGYTLFSCANCEYTYKANYLDPLGHTISEVTLTPTCTNVGERVYSCQVCPYTFTEVIKPLGHSFSALVTMPTLSDMGYTEYTCTNENCDFSYTGDFKFYGDLLPNGAYANNSEILAQGIDISQYNYGAYESIDFASIKESGIDYVIIKAGSSYRDGFTKGGIDPKFEQSYADAKAAGLDVGVYFYTYARSVSEIIQDARLLISILDGKQFEYPIYLDLEDDSLLDIDKTTMTEMCVEFFTILQRAGYYTGLYVNNSWLHDQLQTDVALSKFEIWYARYSDSSDPYIWDADTYGENLGMWQYSDNGHFDAMGDIPFDLSFAYKDYPEIIKNGGFNGYNKDEIKFVDSDKAYVYVIANAINVRSNADFDSIDNLIGFAYKGDCFEVLEKNDEYLIIKFNESPAYITANTSYISFEFPIE